jgi:hypothetical protein
MAVLVRQQFCEALLGAVGNFSCSVLLHALIG